MGYIGLDIGGTNVRYAYVDELDSKLLKFQKKNFVKTGQPYIETEENICNVINMSPGDVNAIGISFAATMNRNTGKVKVWPNNPCWNHYEIVNHLKNKYNIPIVIEDDANCGAIGEYNFFSDSIKNIAYITIGTGVGCGLIINGSLFIGENGLAGELGHVFIGKQNICNCGNKGCFQSIVSGPAVLKEYNLKTKIRLESMEQVFEKFMQNDPSAVKCLLNMTNTISMVIYNIAMYLDISIFVIGGGVSNMGTEFISRIENKTNNRLKSFERNIFVKQAQLGEFSGVYGILQVLKNKLYGGNQTNL